MQRFEEILALGEDVDFFVVIGHCLVEDVSFGAMIHAFHDLFLSIYDIIWLLFEDMTLEVILVVGLPRLRAHVAETFAAGAGHEVAAHRSLNCLLAPGTDLRVLGDPLRIGLFFHDLLDPLGLFLALAGVVIIALTPEAEDLAAVADDCIELHVDFDAVAAVHSCAELVVAIGSDEQLTQLLLEFLCPQFTLFSVELEDSHHSLEENGLWALTIHAPGEG